MFPPTLGSPFGGTGGSGCGRRAGQIVVSVVWEVTGPYTGDEDGSSEVRTWGPRGLPRLSAIVGNY